MTLDFVKISPTQNMTILVTSPVPRSQHAQVAGRLMAYESVSAEQVGFVEPASDPSAIARLQMMGGEFCGNASMALGAYLARIRELPDENTAVYRIEASGIEGCIDVTVRRQGNTFLNTVNMPVPTRIESVCFPNGAQYPVVFMPGIAHAIVPASQISKAVAQECIAGYCSFLNQDCFGMLLWNESTQRMDPLVYVRATDTCVWERGCGSGSAAMGAYFADMQRHDAEATIYQPGGRIRVQALFRGNSVTSLQITGQVHIAAIGQAFL